MPPICFGRTCGYPQSDALQRHIAKLVEPVHKCKILNFKMYG